MSLTQKPRPSLETLLAILRPTIERTAAQHADYSVRLALWKLRLAVEYLEEAKHDHKV